MLSCKQKFDSSIIFFSVFCTVDSRTCIAKIILRVDYFATHIIYSSFVLLLLSNVLIFPYGVERTMIESLLLLTIAYSLLPDVHSLIELFTIWNRMIFGVEWHLQFHIPNSVIFGVAWYLQLWDICDPTATDMGWTNWQTYSTKSKTHRQRLSTLTLRRHTIRLH